jgi:hypothetical protein
MSKGTRKAVDLVAEQSRPTQSVRERIDRRLEVLNDWLKEGIPAGKFVPEGLTAARTWDDIELGILSIGSPNEFTTTHHVHGEKVRAIQKLLTKLRDRFGRPPETPKASSARAEASFDRKAFDRLLATVVSQWHAERDQRLEDKKRAMTAEARAELLGLENAQKDAIIAELRRQLAERHGLRAVE